MSTYLVESEASLAEAIGRVGQRNGYGMDSLLAQLQSVGEKKEDAEKKLAKAEAEYHTYREVQQRLRDLKAWCYGVTSAAREMTYEERRIILFGLNARVTVYPQDRKPWYRLLMGNEVETAVLDATPGQNSADCDPNDWTWWHQAQSAM
jgi:hypothetical protein